MIGMKTNEPLVKEVACNRKVVVLVAKRMMDQRLLSRAECMELGNVLVGNGLLDVVKEYHGKERR